MAAQALSLTIPAGQALSNPIEIPSILKIVRIGMSSDWSPAVPLTFQIASTNTDDSNDFRDLLHADQTPSGLWSCFETGLSQVIPNGILLLPPNVGFGIGWLKLRSGTRSKPVNQSADRTFVVMLDGV